MSEHYEWGVRFPSGTTEPMESEEKARRFSFRATSLRPDLPVLVIRRIVEDWKLVE